MNQTHDARPRVLDGFRAADNALLFVDAQSFERPSAAAVLLAIDDNGFLHGSGSCCGGCCGGGCSRRRGCGRGVVGPVREVQPPGEVELGQTGFRIDRHGGDGSVQTANHYAIVVGGDLPRAANSINLENNIEIRNIIILLKFYIRNLGRLVN